MTGRYNQVKVICLAEIVPETYGNSFNSIRSYSTLYVPFTALTDYQNTGEWQYFGQILPIDASLTVSIGTDALATYCPIMSTPGDFDFYVDFTNIDEIAAYRATIEDDLVKLTRTYKIGRGEGVLLRSLNDNAVIVDVPVILTNIEDPEPNDFIGLTENAILYETDETNNTNYVLSKQENGTVGFYKARPTGINIPVGKAYLPVPNYNSSETSAKGIRLVFDDDTATDIDIADAKHAEDDGTYYTLSGVKVENPTAKGIYIKNGKKYIIK